MDKAGRESRQPGSTPVGSAEHISESEDEKDQLS